MKRTYIDEIAVMIYNRAAFDRPDADPPANEMNLYRIYAVLALAKGSDTTLKDVHDAWASWRSDTFSEHRSIVPFEELDYEVQEYDRPYCEAIHEVADLMTRVTA